LIFGNDQKRRQTFAVFFVLIQNTYQVSLQAMSTITEKQVLEALSHVDDPDLKKDLVTLGMIRDLEINGKKVAFSVVLTTPACPMKEMIERACFNAIKHFVSQDAEPLIHMTSQVTTGRGKQQPLLQGVRNIIAVASGKGGVGKSTISANLAVGLALKGARVGLVDADIYGPSVPIMFDVIDEKPLVKEIDGRNMMIPVESYGVKLLSIGFFADTSQAIVWRGPMASKALNQMFSDAHWGDLDYLIIDLPPGTGDIHLSLVQGIPLTGAIVVSTPQNVALADAQKAIAMFKLPSVNVPVLGVVENMSYFCPPDMPDRKYYVFGQDGAKNLASNMGVPLLGEIPIVQSIREAGDAGRPAVLQNDTTQARAFMEMTENAAREIAIRNASLATTLSSQL
jgi:ATP-binding protein involved in chromosome partitioning